jgi:ATP-dependent Clp protease ATP-binding subunit ClpC
MFERYTEKARRVIFFARYEASQFGSPYIETEHLLLGIVREDKALTQRFLRSQVASIRKQVESHTTLQEKNFYFSRPCAKQGIQTCVGLRGRGSGASRPQAHWDRAPAAWLLQEKKCFAAQILMELGVRLSQIREELARQPHEATHDLRRPAVLDELNPYLSDLVDQTQPLVGRENELDRLIELLCRLTRKNPVLVGEPGVGKRIIVGGLARRIADGNVPQSLAEKAILALDLPPLWVLEKEGSVMARETGSCPAGGGRGRKSLFCEPDA